MRSLRLTARAHADLVEIAQYLIGNASSGVARRVLSDLLSRLDRVRLFPDSGASRSEIRPGLRMIAKHPYALYYVATQSELVVVRVLHGSRDVDAIFSGGGFES